MKVMTYICKQEEIKEKQDWLLSMGLNIFRQTILVDASRRLTSLCMFTFAIPNKEIETFIMLKVPTGVFRDRSA